MEISKDTNALIISIVSLVFTSLWTVIWAIHVRFRDRIRARQLKLSEITNRFVKDGIQDAGYEVGEYLIALGATHPGKLWEVLTCGRASRLAPVEQPQNPLSPEEASLNAFKNNLPEVASLVRRVAGFWDEVTSLWEANELPSDFWGGKPGSGKRVWLHRANNHRMYQECFDIANYYRLGLDKNGTKPSKPYSQSRPGRYWIIQKQWVRDGNMRNTPRGTSTLEGWAKELRSWRAQSPRELPRELTTQPRVSVPLQQLEDELALEDEQAPEWPARLKVPLEGASRAAGGDVEAAGSSAGAAGAQPADSTVVPVGNGGTQHTA